jgi:hypothetical protein
MHEKKEEKKILEVLKKRIPHHHHHHHRCLCLHLPGDVILSLSVVVKSYRA